MTTACSQDAGVRCAADGGYRDAHTLTTVHERDREWHYYEGKPGYLRPAPRESFAATPGRIAVWVSRR